MRRVLLSSLAFATLFAGGGIWLARRGRPESGVRPVRAEPALVREDSAQDPGSVRSAAGPEPAADAATIELVVRARSALGKDAEVLDTLAFEVLRVAGVAPDVPEAFGRRVGVETGAVVTTGVSDAQGVARVELPGDVGLNERGAPNVVVRVCDPRYQQRTARPRIPHGGGTAEALLVTQHGATARGRVLDANGDPVQARVVAQRWYDFPFGRQLRDVVAAQPLPRGAFELHLREDQFGVHLIAQAEGIGTAALAGVDLPLASPPQDLRLVVIGEGALRGRVEDEAGRPVSGLQLLVRLAELDASPDDALESAASLRRAEGRGWTEVRCASDGDGRFDLRGLRPEPYVVRANLRSDSPYGYGTVLTQRPVLAVDGEVLLRVAHPHLVVQLLDASGKPWSGAGAEVGRASRASGWPASPRVLVYPCSPAGSDPEPRDNALDSRVVAPHLLTFAVERGARYLVSVRGESFTAAPSVVDVPPDAGRVELEVRAEPPRGWGVVIPRVIAATPQQSASGHVVFLEDPDTGLRLVEQERYGKERDRIRAPAGRYRLVVEGVADLDFHHGTLMTQRDMGRTEIEIDLRAEEELEVPITLGDGARIDLELVGESNAADLAGALRIHTWLHAPEYAKHVPERAASARVVLRRPRRGLESVHRLVEETGTSAAGTHLSSDWPLGLRETSQIVSPGAWTLVARLPGGREVATDVVLRAGETTPVRLEFAP